MKERLSDYKAVIIGGSSFVGTTLMRSLSSFGFNVVGTYFRNPRNGLTYLDITDERAVAEFISREKPDVVVNSMTLPFADCEKDPELADRLIVGGARNLVSPTKDLGAILIHASTDYVYDGGNRVCKETDTLKPLSVYGNAKARSEDVVLRYDKSVVFRLSSMYGYNGRNLDNRFVGAILNASGDVEFGDVQKKHELYIGNVVSAVTSFLVNPSGLGLIVYNFGGPEAISKYELASELRALNPKIISIRPGNKIGPNVPRKIEMDLSRIRRLPLPLGLTSARDSVDGIRDTIKIFDKN